MSEYERTQSSALARLLSEDAFWSYIAELTLKHFITYQLFTYIKRN